MFFLGFRCLQLSHTNTVIWIFFNLTRNYFPIMSTFWFLCAGCTVRLLHLIALVVWSRNADKKQALVSCYWAFSSKRCYYLFRRWLLQAFLSVWFSTKAALTSRRDGYSARFLLWLVALSTYNVFYCRMFVWYFCLWNWGQLRPLLFRLREAWFNVDLVYSASRFYSHY